MSASLAPICPFCLMEIGFPKVICDCKESKKVYKKIKLEIKSQSK